MPRGIRNAAPLKLPGGVKLATWVPVILVPRAQSSKQTRRADGIDLAKQRKQAVDPNAGKPLAIRYGPCCESHKADMTLEALERAGRLQARCQQLAMQQGHFDLLPGEASLSWVKCEDEQPCRDCIVEACEVLGIATTYTLTDGGRPLDYSSAELMTRIERASREKAA